MMKKIKVMYFYIYLKHCNMGQYFSTVTPPPPVPPTPAPVPPVPPSTKSKSMLSQRTNMFRSIEWIPCRECGRPMRNHHKMCALHK
jgi:hypothetical protein